MSGVSVAQVAQRYAVNAIPIFKWLQDPRFAPDRNGVSAKPLFLPEEIGSEVSGSVDLMPASVEPVLAPTSSGRIEIELAGGHRIRAEAGFDPEVLARLLKGIIH